MEKKSRTMDKLSYYDALGPSAGITVTTISPSLRSGRVLGGKAHVGQGGERDM